MFKKFFKILTAIFFVATLTSCASNAILKEPATITKHEDCMLWELNATDKNGNPSTLYVLGTIHVGDDRLFPIPEKIEQAYIDADNVYGEISGEDNNKIMIATLERIAAASDREAIRIKKTGKTIKDYLTEDEITLLSLFFGGEEGFNNAQGTEPWVFQTMVTTVPIELSGLDPSKSYDTIFTEKCLNEGRTLGGLDTLDTQLDVLEFGDWATQLAMLKDSLDFLIEEPEQAGQDLVDLYEAYLTFDENKVEEVLNAQDEEDEECDYMEEYNEVIFIDRNKDWAEKFANFLNEGGTTFVFAGSGHFVGEDSVFEFMKKNKSLAY